MADDNSQNIDPSQEPTKDESLPQNEEKVFEDIFEHIDIDSIATNIPETTPSDVKNSTPKPSKKDSKSPTKKTTKATKKKSPPAPKEKKDVSAKKEASVSKPKKTPTKSKATKPTDVRETHDSPKEITAKEKPTDVRETRESPDKATTPDVDSSKDKKTTTKSQTTKKQENKNSPTPLDIEDISAYINAKKEDQKEIDVIPKAQDGTVLSEIPNIYAVVPHSKGDHKLVYLREDVPKDLLDDEKQRTKGAVYEKKGMKIYKVHADFKQHPTLKSRDGELVDIWIIDKQDDLTQQLQAIQNGKG